MKTTLYICFIILLLSACEGRDKIEEKPFEVEIEIDMDAVNYNKTQWMEKAISNYQYEYSFYSSYYPVSGPKTGKVEVKDGIVVTPKNEWFDDSFIYLFEHIEYVYNSALTNLINENRKDYFIAKVVFDIDYDDKWFFPTYMEYHTEPDRRIVGCVMWYKLSIFNFKIIEE